MLAATLYLVVALQIISSNIGLVEGKCRSERRVFSLEHLEAQVTRSMVSAG